MDKYEKEHGITPEILSRGQKWPTPTAKDEASSGDAGPNRHKGTTLTDAATKHWLTPRSLTGGGDLQAVALDWPSPGANDAKGSAQKGQRRGQLDEAAEQKFPSSRPVQETTKLGNESSPSPRTSRRRLNPAFTCWLMNFPWWWTRAERISFAAREMASYRSRLRQRLRSFFGE